MKFLFKKRNKKAINWLSTETLKIVLGLIGILLLLGLLASIYFSNVDAKRLIQAKSSLERISSEINSIQYNSEHVGIVTELTPIGWSIFSFTGNSLKPNSCSNQNCACICKSVRENFLVYKVEDRQEKKCSDDGACLIIENLKPFEEIPFSKLSSGFTNIQIQKIDNQIGVIKI